MSRKDVVRDLQFNSNERDRLLFVREHSKDEYGSTMGFVSFGEVEYVSQQGSQPMNIT